MDLLSRNCHCYYVGGGARCVNLVDYIFYSSYKDQSGLCAAPAVKVASSIKYTKRERERGSQPGQAPRAQDPYLSGNKSSTPITHQNKVPLLEFLGRKRRRKADGNAPPSAPGWTPCKAAGASFREIDTKSTD